jgi:phage terminase large subunit GpA-like protein
VTSVALDTEQMADAGALYAKARKFYAPQPRVPIVEWIEREYLITKDSGAAHPGPYRFAAVPWWREVAESLADESTEEIVIAKSSQVGYTELLMAFIGWTMAQDPSSMLAIQPTVEMAESWSKERLAPVLRDVPALKNIMRSETRGMARSSDDTLRRKVYAGGWLAIMGSNSAAGLASRPVRRVLGDERDRWPVSAGSEGDPFELAKRRTTTFWNKKQAEGGTPLEEDTSPTWAKFLLSDQRHWHVPCPHCGEFQALRWRDESGVYHLVCDRDENGRLIPETAQYRCAYCACLIDEKHKAAMVSSGKWIAEHPGRRVRGYHVWSAYSPWMSWAEIIRDFGAARGAEEKLRTFVNTILGLPFAAKAEKIDPTSLLARAEPMADPPPEIGLLTAGVDVQADRIEYLVTGWGAGERQAMLSYGQVEGDPGQDSTWDKLDEALSGTWGGLRISAAAVDTGYRPETGWKWSERRHAYKVFPVKGEDGRGRPLIQKPGAVTRKRQRRPWIVGVDTAKDSLASRLRSAPEGPQGVRFSEDLPPEFYDHLTAEKLTTVFVGSRPTRKWLLIPGRRNEGLDMAVYALAALHGLGTPTVRALGVLAEKRMAAQAPKPVEKAAESEQVPRPTSPQRPRGNWANRWR